MVFFPKAKISDQDVKKYLLKIDSDVVIRAEEQDAIWSELDELGKNMQPPQKTVIDTDSWDSSQLYCSFSLSDS